MTVNQLTLTWDDLRERARNHEELSADKRRDAVLTFDTLQGIFRTSFFGGKQHPLFPFSLTDQAGDANGQSGLRGF
jgi:hypothetical protein